ncbi:Cd2+/Zn2+-exporting ATPase [Caminicella sporogenes DSM 14501]|uniref:Cd2+/Zn2+-exporting ATPase n=1 Tax=Caminicella sporogenes DSM 14501 TaxID=1121266 RepID=A0A1M6PHF0_9FIRM|nr:heavy metal translocating P-type ATPase [Caminicella sporogenes]RKD21399.1 cadmium-translocating P-type ATPase [Caminicella sporogenes]SHK07344.1 Cd2+/Zn2+-exporting ATPase [Caminicella sporogenes DSM 14501]
MSASSKVELILEGLDCANCASKIEAKVNEIGDVKSANLNFVTKTLTVEVKDNKKTKSTISAIKNIVNRYEPHVVVKEKIYHYNKKGNIAKNSFKREFIPMIIGAVIFIIAVILKFSFWLKISLFLASYLLIGGKILFKAIKNIQRGQIFDENFLMVIATIGAFAIGEYPEGVAVMLFYQIGEFMQNLAVNKSRKSITELMDIRPDYANLKTGEKIEKVLPDKVKIGDLIIVKPGEKIPLDGIIVEGESMVDTAALTGESIPRKVKKGNEVLSGFVNKNGVLTVKVSKEFGESTVSKILNLVQNASSKKAKTENFITKFARYYTPFVVFSALAIALIPPIFLNNAKFSDWIYRALVFLVVSCPCALVVSIPLGFFGGIGGASKNGILIKGGNYLEGLNDVDTVVFDKTGTLTKGVFKVVEIREKGSINKSELLEYAAYAESYSNHPIAKSILKKYDKEIIKEYIKNYNEISGCGIKATIRGKEILVGNDKLMEREKIRYEKINAFGTVVYIAVDKQYAGYIVISDEIKKDSERAIKGLKSLGINNIVMFTGDNKNVANKIAEKLGIDKVYSELLPQDKVEKIESLEREKKTKGKLVFVGDGINDAPVLARADIGVAMGALGSDAAIEASDVVIMTDEPSKLINAIKIARRTKKIVWQNIIFSLGIKGIVLLLGAIGYATMWEAVFADVGVALLAILNAMRVLRVGID